MIAPVRLQLSRRKGFNLQAVSHAVNGLSAVNCARPGKWGNPFIVGKRNPCGTITQDQRHAFMLYVGFAPINEPLVAAAQAELRGKNLACWCEIIPYEKTCHCDVLLELANAPLPGEGGE